MHELHEHSTAGKGDADRSPNWRDNYAEIASFKKDKLPGFVKTGPARYRKVYPTQGIALENFDTGEIFVCGNPEPIGTVGITGLPGAVGVDGDQCGDACGCRPRHSRH